MRASASMKANNDVLPRQASARLGLAELVKGLPPYGNTGVTRSDCPMNFRFLQSPSQ